MEKTPTFHIGIAMAGAVSAGAYTAGVIDYLLETLEKWEQAKAHNRRVGPGSPEYDPSVPMHNVVLEVMGGSSAGGMTAAVTTLALYEGFEPVGDPGSGQDVKNKLWDTWVNLNDQKKMTTLEQMLGTADIDDTGQVHALLNSRPIDAIADRANNLTQIGQLPPYISSQLEVIMTVTSMTGIPLAVDFFDAERGGPKEEELPAHRMYLHKGIAHFRAGQSDEVLLHTVPFDPHDEGSRDLLIQCAKATGAFPLGLKARVLKDIRLSYLRAMIYRTFGFEKIQSEDYLEPSIRLDTDRESFDLVAVDGGTINNEPFGEVIRSMEERCKSHGDPYAILMIDPFPNFEGEEEENTESIEQSPTILALVPDLVGALRSQAMVKEQEIVRGLSNDHTRRMIFPKREGDPYPIASGSLAGFGGFFSRAFREYDFKLGRKNCQKFLRLHFNIPIEEAARSEIFKDWRPDDADLRHQRFFIPDKLNNFKGFYPIIPDMDAARGRARAVTAPYIAPPDKPRIHPDRIFDLTPLIEQRIQAVLKNILPQPAPEKPSKYHPDTTEHVNRIMVFNYGVKAIPKEGETFGMRILKWLYKKFVSKRLAKSWAREVVRTILLDFKQRGLLEEEEQG